MKKKKESVIISIAEYKTLIILSLLFNLLFIILEKVWILWISIFLLLIGATSSYLTSLIVKFWVKLTGIIGVLNSKIILTLIYFLILFPLSIIRRLLDPDPLKIKPIYNTTWIERNKEFNKKDFEKMW